MALSYLSFSGSLAYVAYYIYSNRKETTAHNTLVLDHRITLPNESMRARCKSAFKFLIYTAILPIGIYKFAKKAFRTLGRPSIENKLPKLQAIQEQKNARNVLAKGASWLKAKLVNTCKQVQHLDFISYDNHVIEAIHIPSKDGLSKKVIIQVAMSKEDAENQRATWLSQYSSKVAKHALFIVCPRENGGKIDPKLMARDVYSAARQVGKNRKEVTAVMGCDSLGSLVAAKAANMLQNKLRNQKISAILFEPIQSFSTMWKEHQTSFYAKALSFLSFLFGFDIRSDNYLKRLRGKVIVVNASNPSPKESFLSRINAGFWLSRKCKWEKTPCSTYSGASENSDASKISSLIKINC